MDRRTAALPAEMKQHFRQLHAPVDIIGVIGKHVAREAFGFITVTSHECTQRLHQRTVTRAQPVCVAQSVVGGREREIGRQQP